MKPLLAILLLLASAPMAAVSAESEVKAQLEKLAQAGLRRDVPAMQKIYTKDYFHTNPDGSVMDLATVFDSYRASTPFTFDSSVSDEQRIIVHGNLAVVNERITLHGVKKDAGPFTSRYRVTYVLEKQGGEWMVLNSHSSLLGIEPGK